MKAFLSTLAGLIVVVILAAVVVGSIFWSRVPDMLANNLSKKMLVSVEIDSMGLGWGKIDLKRIKIGNPSNSILARAFACREIDIYAPFFNYTKQNVVINEIDLKDVYLGLEFDSASGTRGNWTRIMSNIQSTTGSQSATGREKKKKKKVEQITSSNRTVLIHTLVLTNIDVDVVYRNGGKVIRLPRIDRIELKEISSEGGLPMDQIMNSVLGQMLKEVFMRENLKNMLQDLIDIPSPIQPYIAPFKGLFGKASD